MPLRVCVDSRGPINSSTIWVCAAYADQYLDQPLYPFKYKATIIVEMIMRYKDGS
jgi:hypothetical protein